MMLFASFAPQERFDFASILSDAVPESGGADGLLCRFGPPTPEPATDYNGTGQMCGGPPLPEPEHGFNGSGQMCGGPPLSSSGICSPPTSWDDAFQAHLAMSAPADIGIFHFA